MWSGDLTRPGCTSGPHEVKPSDVHGFKWQFKRSVFDQNLLDIGQNFAQKGLNLGQLGFGKKFSNKQILTPVIECYFELQCSRFFRYHGKGNDVRLIIF